MKEDGGVKEERRAAASIYTKKGSMKESAGISPRARPTSLYHWLLPQIYPQSNLFRKKSSKSSPIMAALLELANPKVPAIREIRQRA